MHALVLMEQLGSFASAGCRFFVRILLGISGLGSTNSKEDIGNGNRYRQQELQSGTPQLGTSA